MPEPVTPEPPPPKERESRAVEPKPEPPAVRPAPSERVRVEASEPPEPAPSNLPPGSVSLDLAHRPVTAGDSGASDLVLARVDGPADTRVVLHAGPAGGPFQQTTLKARGSGRWETWLKFSVPSGSRMEYWITASHPAADGDASSASRSAPHVVDVR